MLKSLLNKKNNKGFTLVELIVVIAIMAILAVAVTPKLTQFLDKSKIATDKEIANTVCTAFTSVSLDADDFATCPSEYKSGTNILVAESGTGATRYLYFEKSGNTYTAKVVSGKTLGKFEQAVKDILPANFTLKSNQWTRTGITPTLTVTVSGEGIVTVVLSDGEATNPVTYTVAKN